MNMEKIKIIRNIFIASCFLGILTGCDLEREFITYNTKETVNEQVEYYRGMCVALYDNLPIPFDNGLIYFESPITDESNDVWIGDSEAFNTASWNQFSGTDQVIGSYYNAIRRINDFLSPVAEVDLESWRLSPLESDQVIYENYVSSIANWKREARFLRAFFYFELIKRYGGMPIITEPLTLDADFSAIKRNTLSECFKFIIDELNDITKDGDSLPLSYDNENLGRATKGAALALKSRALLYKASDLFNSPNQWASGYGNPELISIQGEDRQSLWRAAADAAKAVIDLETYTLASDYTIIGKNFTDKEFIFLRRVRDQSNSFEWENLPRGYLTARGRINPSQNLVDAYEMTDGSKFNWTTHGLDPYYNRDPRFSMTIYHNEALFKGSPLEIFEGGLHGSMDHTTQTGYYIKKFIDEGLDMQQDRKSYHTWCFFRIAEIYLNYAEALNEYSPGNADILTYVNKTRQRTGVRMPNITETDQTSVRERIYNERQIELAFEGHRIWDLRRWMKAEAVLNQPLRGVKIKYEDYEYKYEQVTVEQRRFLPRMYFHPIPQSLLLTEGVEWPQNPLW